MSLPADPFGRSRPPPGFTREDRVRWIHEVAAALLAGLALAPRAAALFVGGALDGWLREGRRVGDLERCFLKTAQKERSHLSAQVLSRRLRVATTTAPTNSETIRSDEPGEGTDETDDDDD